MDLDGDGLKDVITGSPKGVCHFFRGEGGGKFAASRLLTHPDGKEIKLGAFANVTTVDWNGDGILDLVAYASGGSQKEALRVLIGQGDLVYDEPIPLIADGQPFLKSDQRPQGVHDGRVYFVDWDNDGTPDLILSRGDGSVTVHQGRRNECGALELAAGEMLIEPFPKSESEIEFDPRTLELTQPRCGRRPTAIAVDWNGDGLLDLLVGDMLTTRMVDELSPEIRSREGEVYAQHREANNRLEALLIDLIRETMVALGKPSDFRPQNLSFEEYSVFQEHYDRLKKRPQVLELQQQVDRLFAETAKFHRKSTTFGYVWVYLRKPADSPTTHTPGPRRSTFERIPAL